MRSPDQKSLAAAVLFSADHQAVFVRGDIENPTPKIPNHYAG